MQLYGQTDKGLVRSNNQDTFYLCQINETTAFALVCDGMGGAAAGNVASQMATRVISDYVRKSYNPRMTFGAIETMLRGAVSSANATVFAKSSQNPDYKGMGTTVVLAYVVDRTAYILHVGDSRAYLYDGTLHCLTVDHSVVQSLLDSGKITAQEAIVHPQRHMITRALGISDDVCAELDTVQLPPGSTLLLCSDGLSNCVEDDKIKERLSAPTQQTPDQLIADALDGGGTDNVTAVLIAMD